MISVYSQAHATYKVYINVGLAAYYAAYLICQHAERLLACLAALVCAVAVGAEEQWDVVVLCRLVQGDFKIDSDLWIEGDV